MAITPESLADMSPLSDRIAPEFESEYTRILRYPLAEVAAAGGDKMRREAFTALFVHTLLSLCRSAGGGSRGHRRRHLRFRVTAREMAAIQSPGVERKDEIQADEDSEQSGEKKRKEEPVNDIDTATVKRAVRQIEMNQMSKAARTLLQNGILDPAKPTVLAKMEALHPQNTLPMPSLPPDAKDAKIEDEEEVKRVIAEMAGEGTAGGLSGMTASHLKPLLSDRACRRGLMAIVRAIANGDYGEAMREVFVTSKGLAIPKQANVEEPRPIGIPETLTRVAETVLARRDRVALREAMGDEQLGYGVRAGPDSIAHLAQAALTHALEQKRAAEEQIGILHLDAKNAFNSCERADILRTLYSNERLSALWKLADFIYGRPSRIVLRGQKKVEAVLKSSQGTKQGCPLGMALFDLAIAENLKSIAAVDQSVKVAALHDDIYLIGPVSKLRKVYEHAVQSLATKGLQIQARKSELVCFSPLAQLPEAVQRWVESERLQYSPEATRIAGGFVANSETAADEKLAEELRDHKKLFDRVRHGAMPALHGMIILQKAGQPRYSFTTRATRPSVVKRAATKFDASLIEAFADKVNVPIEPASREHAQASLPHRLGGFGYQQHADIAPFAWWASQAAAAPILAKLPYATSETVETERRAVLQHIRSQAAEVLTSQQRAAIDEVLPESAEQFIEFYTKNPSASERLQNKLSQIPIALRARQAAGDSADDAARMKSLAAANSANRWFVAVPKNPSLSMSDSEVSDAVRRALGRPPAPANAMPSTCGQCQTMIGPQDPWHPLTCVSNTATGKCGRHDGIVRELKTAVEEAGGSAVQEPTGLDLKSKKKPDLDIMADGNLWLDAVIRHSQAPTYMQRGGDCLKQAEKFKRDKYHEMVESAEHPVQFVPFAVDTFGRLGGDAQAFIEKLSAFAQANGVMSAKKFKRLLLNRLAIVLQKHNSAISRRWLVDERWRAKKLSAMRELERAAGQRQNA